MNIKSDRFGTIELDEQAVIDFKDGVIGFPQENGFVLVQHGDSPFIGWLQSVKSPELAFPVVSAHGLSDAYPDVPIDSAASDAGVEASDDLAVLAVLSAKSGSPSTVNLLAPIVVNADTRKGAQVILEGSRFTTRELFVLPGVATQATGTDGV